MQKAQQEAYCWLSGHLNTSQRGRRAYKAALVHEAAQLALWPQRQPALQSQLQAPLPELWLACTPDKGVAHVVHHPVRALQQEHHLAQVVLSAWCTNQLA